MYVLVKVLLSRTLYFYSYAVPVGLKMQGIFKLTGIREHYFPVSAQIFAHPKFRRNF